MSKSNSDHQSETSSNIGLDSISFNRQRPLPEEWTLPSEWNMEQRELYDNWKLDLQSQIKNLDQKLVESLRDAPQAELGAYYDMHTPQDLETIKKLRLELLAGKMQKGLKRQ